MGKRATPPFRVGVFDQIVSGGGVRLFTSKLVEELVGQGGDEWRFHLMWTLFDSSDNFLPRPRLKRLGFERINLEGRARGRNELLFRLGKIFERRVLLDHQSGLMRRLGDYERRARAGEQKGLRAGDGAGLSWLDARAEEFDLLYLPYPYLTLPVNEEWLPKKPLVITLHDLAHEQTDAWGDLTETLRREVRRWAGLADLVVFSSDFIKDEAQRIYGIPDERAVRIYLAPERMSNHRRSAATLRRYGLDKKYVFTLGWASKHKRVDAIVEGFAIFKRQTGADVALVIAGPKTETLAACDTHGLELGRDLFALGYVGEEEIPILYGHAEAVVTASVSEAGLNAVIFDAMKYEKPVLCSRIPQFVERLGTDDSLAVMFDPASPRSLAEAFAKHFADPTAAARRIADAKQFIDSRTLTDVGRDYLAAFASVLRRRA